ncbi:MAG: transcription elongation factor GreA [Candidatus Magasanikbacteria bacterium]
MEDDTQIQYMTQEKIDNLNEELVNLKNNKIPALANRIDEARQMGDLSENAEYHAAREDMAWAQSRVQEIQYILENAVVITDDHTSVIQVGSSIRVRSNGIEKEYKIVGAQEADPIAGKISNESPLGSSFLGKKKGDKVQVKLPSGIQEYKIIEVK